MILKAIYNYFFLLHSIVVCYFCSASRLIVCQIPSAVLSFRRGVVFIVVHDTKIRFVYHFLISLHIGYSACIFHMFMEACYFIMIYQVFFRAIMNMLKSRSYIYQFDVRIFFKIPLRPYSISHQINFCARRGRCQLFRSLLNRL